MGDEGTLSFSVASVVEDVLQQHGNRLRDLDLESRKAEEEASRRYEAASWLRKMVGVVAAKDLPAEPSEEEFRLGLRSGIILCNVLNKVQPGAVSKVVESPCDTALIPDGAPLSAYQYFENVRNFLVAVQEMGIPTFEASDLEQGGKSARVVSSVLALKSYSDWKQSGGTGVWKFGGNVKTYTTSKSFGRKNPDPFTSSLSRNSSMDEKFSSIQHSELGSQRNPSGSHSLSMLVRTLLSDKKADEVPTLIESVLNKVVEEFEHRISNQYELVKPASKDLDLPHRFKSLLKCAKGETKHKEENVKGTKKEESFHGDLQTGNNSNEQLLKQQTLLYQQHKDIQELRHTLLTTKSGMQFMQRKFLEEFHNIGMFINSLAHAASGYHRVLEENRKLYNEVQDLKGSIRVYCRVRPFLSRNSNYLSTVDHIEDGTITINTSSKHGKGHRSFNFNKVFGPSATQVEVFADMQPLIRSVLDGYNVCIFAYGQTGSGKTYTMTGPKELTEKNQGVNYRALGDLFLLAEQRKNEFHYDVAVQMIEIYNEQVRDLLYTDGSNKRLEIRNRSQAGLSVPDASLVPVSSTADVTDLMNLGQRNRAVGATALNDRSSRSHSCLTVHVQGRDLTSGTILRGCMHLVDLAGSERVDKSEVTGDRLREAQHINKSLSALGDVIASLAQKNSHVPYRNSKLTQLLQDSLGGQAKTLMFVHISPELDALGETISTLKFAERVSVVELGAARVNKDSADVKLLKEQKESLKAALARKGDRSQHVSGSLETYRSKVGEASPYNSMQRGVDAFGHCNNNFQQSNREAENKEARSNSTRRQKKQSYDFEELLANSPPWPPVSNGTENYWDDDKEAASGEWVDKVMVNKQDLMNRDESPSSSWEANNAQSPDMLCSKYLSDSSQSYDMFLGASPFNVSNTDGVEDLDAITSDSSESDLLWQFNNSKLPGIAHDLGSKSKNLNQKAIRSPDVSRSYTPSLGRSPSRKQANGVGPPLHQNGRHPAPAEPKRKSGNGNRR